MCTPSRICLQEYFVIIILQIPNVSTLEQANVVEQACLNLSRPHIQKTYYLMACLYDHVKQDLSYGAPVNR